MSIVAARLSAYADLGDAWLCDFRDERNERPVTTYTGQSIRRAPPSPMGRGCVKTMFGSSCQMTRRVDGVR